jgi:hypothetical protein
MKRLVAVIFFFLQTQAVLANAENVIVNVEQKVEGKELTLKFIVKAKTGFKLNFDASAPWQLKLKKDGPKYFAEVYSAKDLRQDLPGFVVTSKTALEKKDLSIAYELVTFSCTDKDKQACFRQVIKGEYLKK